MKFEINLMRKLCQTSSDNKYVLDSSILSVTAGCDHHLLLIRSNKEGIYIFRLSGRENFFVMLIFQLQI
jgi:hypothetical protein